MSGPAVFRQSFPSVYFAVLTTGPRPACRVWTHSRRSAFTSHPSISLFGTSAGLLRTSAEERRTAPEHEQCFPSNKSRVQTTFTRSLGPGNCRNRRRIMRTDGPCIMRPSIDGRPNTAGTRGNIRRTGRAQNTNDAFVMEIKRFLFCVFENISKDTRTRVSFFRMFLYAFSNFFFFFILARKII